ncbi:MAG: flavodoxin [Thomasclavelia spiroformis]
MKKFISILLTAILAISLTGCTSSSNNDNSANDTTTNENTEQNILIAYYSLSGNTKAAAEEIQKQAGGDLVEITRTEAYPEDFYDLAENEIINHEQPAITLSINNIDDYDVIFVGYPIWWQEAPAMINTFVHQFDFTDKTVIPFCTSSSDGIEESLDVFDDIQDQATVKEGLRISDYDDIPDWLDQVLDNN